MKKKNKIPYTEKIKLLKLIETLKNCYPNDYRIKFNKKINPGDIQIKDIDTNEWIFLPWQTKKEEKEELRALFNEYNTNI